MLYFVQMNKYKKTRCTTVFLTDVRMLEDEEVFSRLFLTVNPERQRDIDSKGFDEEKVLSLAGGLLLDALLEHWGIAAEVEHDLQGKPVVKGCPDVFVSLSHSYPYAAAVIAAQPCGIDLESHDRDFGTIAKRFYSQKEREYAKEDPIKMAQIWCRKECIIKYERPQDVRNIDTFDIPEHYGYRSFPLEGFSFEVLIPKGACDYMEIDFSKGRGRK